MRAKIHYYICHILVMKLINIGNILWKRHILKWYRGCVFLLGNFVWQTVTEETLQLHLCGSSTMQSGRQGSTLRSNLFSVLSTRFLPLVHTHLLYCTASYPQKHYGLLSFSGQNLKFGHNCFLPRIFHFSVIQSMYTIESEVLRAS